MLVVGGGPAGATLARRLVAAGRETVVVDRATFPRDKVCAGWITPAVVRAVEMDTADYRRTRVLQPFHGFRTARMGGPSVATRYGRPISYGILRRQLDHWQLARSGARRITGETVSAIERDGAGWIVNGRHRCRLLVGAGGHGCPVARLLGADGRREAPVVAQELELELDDARWGDCPLEPTLPELTFCADLAGYGWAVRKGRWLNVGLGRQDPRGLPGHVGAFHARLIEAGRIPADTPAAYRGHAYLLNDDSPRSLIGDGVLLIGDAAGLADPMSGEGIGPAVESALLAADTILAAGADVCRRRLRPYQQRLEARFGRRGRRRRGAAVPAAVRRLASRPLLAWPWFARHVVLDRWFLRRRRPPLRLARPGDGLTPSTPPGPRSHLEVR